MPKSYIQTSPSGTTFVGPESIRLYQASVIRSSLRLLQKGICPIRGLTMTRALATASSITGKPYKRTQSQQAIADLTTWCDETATNLPTTTP